VAELRLPCAGCQAEFSDNSGTAGLGRAMSTCTVLLAVFLLVLPCGASAVHSLYEDDSLCGVCLSKGAVHKPNMTWNARGWDLYSKSIEQD
jgi:hypothetical protein